MKRRGTTRSGKAYELDVSMYPVPAELSKFFLGFLLVELQIPEGETISDIIVPTWGLLNWRDRSSVTVRSRSGEMHNAGLSGGIGPYDHAVEVFVGPMRQWSAVLLPAAWSRYVKAPARAYANRTFDTSGDAAFAVFHPLSDALFAGEPDSEAELAMIFDSLSSLAAQPVTDAERRVNTIFMALMDAKIARVGELAGHAGLTSRTLERVCDASFGLPPKVLLRRQRFLRSMTQYMANDRQESWIEVMDHLYHDQPQFVREFRQIMGMAPSEFVEVERPLMEAVMLMGLRYWQEAKRLAEAMRE